MLPPHAHLSPAPQRLPAPHPASQSQTAPRARHVGNRTRRHLPGGTEAVWTEELHAALLEGKSAHPGVLAPLLHWPTLTPHDHSARDIPAQRASAPRPLWGNARRRQQGQRDPWSWCARRGRGCARRQGARGALPDDPRVPAAQDGQGALAAADREPHAASAARARGRCVQCVLAPSPASFPSLAPPPPTADGRSQTRQC